MYLPSLVTPRFAQGKRIRYAIYEYDPLIDSSEIEPTDWINIATDIERNYQSFDGFIVLHGTDTLAFSASALSFLLVRRDSFSRPPFRFSCLTFDSRSPTQEDLGRAGLVLLAHPLIG